MLLIIAHNVLNAELRHNFHAYRSLLSIKNPVMNQKLQSKHTLNTRRLLCPMPVIRTQEAVKKLTTGEILEIIGTDSGILQDIPAWCRINGHAVLDIFTNEFDYHIVLQVG